MFLVWMLHPLWLLVAAAVQFGAVRRAVNGSRAWRAVSAALTIAAAVAFAAGVWLAFTAPAPSPRVAPPPLVPMGVLGRNLAWGAAVVGGAGVAGWLGGQAGARWFRRLEIASWVLAALVACAAVTLFGLLMHMNLH